MELPPELASVGRARGFCRDRLAAWGADGLVEVVTLLVSELVTNAVVHARTPCEVELCRREVLRVEVIDHDPRPPVRQDHDPASASGRGLLLVAELSDASGVDRDGSGKRVWFELAWPARHGG